MPEQGNPISSPDASLHTGGPDLQAGTGSVPHIRALATPLKKAQIHQLEDGDLLIKDWPMLAEGNWTDSALGTPLLYPAKTLEEFAGNWHDKSGWSRHTGGVPRRATEKVGEAVSPHFGQFPDPAGSGAMLNGVISDIRVYGFTQAGRDMQELIKRKLIKYVSVEHGGDERMNPATRQMEATSLTFYGFAFVNKGACESCRIHEQPQPSPAPKETPAAMPAEEPMADTKELESQVATLMKELEAAKAQKPAEVKAEIPKELSDLITAQGNTIKQLEGTVKELASRPAPAQAAAPAEARELGTVEYFVAWDPKAGTIKEA